MNAAGRSCKALPFPGATPVLRFHSMAPPRRHWWLALALLLPCGAPASAQDRSPFPLDQGRFVIFDHGHPIATETFAYPAAGDSILISSIAERKLRGPDGEVKTMTKKLGMVVNAFDFGLRSYTSNQEFDGHVTVKGVIPGDTSMTVYSEIDGAGNADRIRQPPGRLYIMDPMLFTLFDVIGRGLHGKTFTTRPIELLTLGATSGAVEATVEDAGNDTLRWGGRRTIARQLVLRDESGRFTVWMSSAGRMLRLENVENDLVVMREPPARGAPPAQPRRPKAR